MSTRNYNLNESDFDIIDNQWDADANERYGVDYNGIWYKKIDED